MLYLKNATNDPQSMSQDGDAILRSLQNKSLPMVDLLVRESLQNSLDASLPSKKYTEVEFRTGQFESERLADNFQKIDEVLMNSYPGAQEYLSISDKNTYGLTGDYKSSDIASLEKSNFHKLVFGIGKNQEKAGAGGSWGLGKTSFFRIGIGLVIYYTRILTDNGYEERLIASLIESPKSESRILKENHRGIAWWGEIDGDLVYPVTNSSKIEKILRIFDIESYRGDETGTTIIIPYVNNIDKKISDDTETFNWEENLSMQIKMAVQRWYNPRIMNETYLKQSGNPSLSCKINNELISPIEMEPIFLIFQELYNAALTSVSKNEKITVVPIDRPQNIMRNSHEAVGNIAFCEVSRDDLKMSPPHNKPSGLAYLGIKDTSKLDNNFSKVIAYTRKPGMILEYGVDEGEWIPHNVVQQDDHLLLAFFVPNSSGQLTNKLIENGYDDLESYLRATESADHANWIDEDGITIIRRIKSHSKKAIDDFYQGDETPEKTSKVSGLSRRYGKILMPPKNFGRTSTKNRETRNNLPTRVGNKMSSVAVERINLLSDTKVEIAIDIQVKKGSVSELFSQILTQEQRLDETKWNKLMDESLEYPFIIEKVLINSLNDKNYDCFVEGETNLDNVVLDLKTNPLNYLAIKNSEDVDVTIKATIYLDISSNQYIPNIAIRTNNFTKEGDR